MYDTYDIRDISALENDSQSIISKSDKIINLVAEIKDLANKVKVNWETNGTDLQSYLYEIEKCTGVLENSFIPAIKEYANVLSQLAEATKVAQSHTISN